MCVCFIRIKIRVIYVYWMLCMYIYVYLQKVVASWNKSRVEEGRIMKKSLEQVKLWG